MTKQGLSLNCIFEGPVHNHNLNQKSPNTGPCPGLWPVRNQAVLQEMSSR